jgi:hypothetical protein
VVYLKKKKEKYSLEDIKLKSIPIPSPYELFGIKKKKKRER